MVQSGNEAVRQAWVDYGEVSQEGYMFDNDQIRRF